MSDKMKPMENTVKLRGVVTELEVRKGEAKATESGTPACKYVSVKGEIQFGTHKAQSRRFECFVKEKKKGGKDNGLYQPTIKFANSAKTVSKDGFDDATFVEVQGSFEMNDYVNSQEKLVESLGIKATFFNDVDDFDNSKTMNENLEALGRGIADVGGYIRSITPETKGEDETETGRLKMMLISNNFFGDVIPLRNIMIPAESAEAFEEMYEEGQTATLSLDYTLNKSEKEVKTGGWGKQRTTDGKTYVELVAVGGGSPLDEDEEGAIEKGALKVAMQARKEMLEELKDKGYQGNKGKSNSGNSSTGSKPDASADLDDSDELPF